MSLSWVHVSIRQGAVDQRLNIYALPYGASNMRPVVRIFVVPSVACNALKVRCGGPIGNREGGLEGAQVGYSVVSPAQGARQLLPPRHARREAGVLGVLGYMQIADGARYRSREGLL